ncbi:hypothetical protein ASZ78_007166 [Callipepla squamata]|uniref:LysM domain-containing protein n=1 Tax=Callipepla squamata TaxID=9009 RepID=A0A226MKV4_CALSU|nr:hypothetical protein ASZ78_007166 [Callipepla squamata]
MAGDREHRVGPGDTLPGLALRYGVTMEQIQRANRLYASDTIFLKPTLLIPAPQCPVEEPTGSRPSDPGGTAAAAAAPPPPDLTAADFLRRVDADIGRSKAAAVAQRLRAGDRLYAFALGGDPRALYPQRSVTWEPRDRAGCAVRGEVQDGCHNHIRVLLPRDARTLFVCGTNAFNPVCRTYQALTLQQEGDELPGQARCPFDARQSIAATFADDSLYSATVADFQASDAVIYRSVRGPALRSIKYSSRWLREPHFIHAMPHGAHVYFFFREMAAELGLPGKVGRPIALTLTLSPESNRNPDPGPNPITPTRPQPYNPSPNPITPARIP